MKREELNQLIAKDLLKIKAVFSGRKSPSPGPAASRALFTVTTG